MWPALGAAFQPVLRVAEQAPLPTRAQPKPLKAPVQHEALPSTPESTLDQMLQGLKEGSAKWQAMGCKERATLLSKCRSNFIAKSKQLAELGTQAKGSWGAGIGEELSTMCPVVLGFTEYIKVLMAGGQLSPLSTRTAASGHPVAQVFPTGILNLLFTGCVGEVWCEPGKPMSQGQLYREKAAAEAGNGKSTGSRPAVSLVLGAGNQLPVVVLDILHKLVAEDQVVIVKMSPVNEYIGPVLEQVFLPLYSYVKFAYGGPSVGKYLTSHPLVDAVHLTGSPQTFNAIVWQGQTPREGVSPPLQKHVTAELGCVTPYIIVPGDWSDEEIKIHAKNIVAGKATNSGHNCCALEILVTDKSWPLRPKLLAAIREELSRLPARAPYYPGSQAKREAFRQAHRGHQVEELGACTEAGAVPWLLVEGLSPEDADTQMENFCGVMQEVCLPSGPSGSSASAFLKAALEFTEKCWGSLSCAVFIHPETRKALGDAEWDTFIGKLNYGNISVNAPTTFGYAITCLPWGAPPGNTVADCGSGIGFVHNTMLFDTAVKGVITAPWRAVPKPLWLVDLYHADVLVPIALHLLGSLDNTPLAFMWVTAAASVAALR